MINHVKTEVLTTRLVKANTYVFTYGLKIKEAHISEVTV